MKKVYIAIYKFILEEKPLPTHFSDIISVVIWICQEYLREIHFHEAL